MAINPINNVNIFDIKSLGFDDFDVNNDGLIQKKEWVTTLEENEIDEIDYDIVDSNGDSNISPDEYSNFLANLVEDDSSSGTVKKGTHYNTVSEMITANYTYFKDMVIEQVKANNSIMPFVDIGLVEVLCIESMQESSSIIWKGAGKYSEADIALWLNNAIGAFNKKAAQQLWNSNDIANTLSGIEVEDIDYDTGISVTYGTYYETKEKMLKENINKFKAIAQRQLESKGMSESIDEKLLNSTCDEVLPEAIKLIWKGADYYTREDLKLWFNKVVLVFNQRISFAQNTKPTFGSMTTMLRTNKTGNES